MTTICLVIKYNIFFWHYDFNSFLFFINLDKRFCFLKNCLNKFKRSILKYNKETHFYFRSQRHKFLYYYYYFLFYSFDLSLLEKYHHIFFIYFVFVGHFIFLCYKHGMSSRDALMDAVNKLPFLFELKYHLVKALFNYFMLWRSMTKD